MKITLIVVLFLSSLSLRAQNEEKIESKDSLICLERYKFLLETTTNYVLKIRVSKCEKVGRCDCFENHSKCYLYSMQIDSILFLENEKPYDVESLKLLLYFASPYKYLKEDQIIIGLFRNSYDENFIYLERILPIVNVNSIYMANFVKEFISTAGLLECINNRKPPFKKFFKKKKVKSGVPPQK